MDLTPENIIALISAYLLGSIPTAVWVGKLFYGIDVRNHGSGNAGATNTFRILGPRAGVPVLFVDTMKGYFAVKLFFILGTNFSDSASIVNFKLALGIMAMIGHIFPIFAKFRGGKGIATLVGFMIGVHLFATLICIGIFLVFLFSTRYVSLGSIMGAVCFPILIIFFFRETVPSLTFFSVCITLIVLITHRNNIKRLLKKEELKVYFFKKDQVGKNE